MRPGVECRGSAGRRIACRRSERSQSENLDAAASFFAADEALYYANQFVMRSRDRGKTWEKISGDLARVNPTVPETLDPLTAKDIDQADDRSLRRRLFHWTFTARSNNSMGGHR